MSLRDRWQPDGAARRLRAVGRAIAWIRVGYILAVAGLIYACAGRRLSSRRRDIRQRCSLTGRIGRPVSKPLRAGANINPL